MKKIIYSIALLSSFMLTSCEKDDDNDDNNDASEENFQSLDSFFEDQEVESVERTFNAENGIEFTTEKGTVVTIPANAFKDQNGAIVTGEVDFINTSGPVSLTYTSIDHEIVFQNTPSITAISVDDLSNDTANVNIFITAITTTSVTFESSAPFTGKVNFQIVSQD